MPIARVQRGQSLELPRFVPGPTPPAGQAGVMTVWRRSRRPRHNNFNTERSRGDRGGRGGRSGRADRGVYGIQGDPSVENRDEQREDNTTEAAWERDRVRSASVCRGLDGEEVGIETTRRHQFFVASRLRDMGAVHHDDPIGHANGRESMGDEHDHPAVRGAAT